MPLESHPACVWEGPCPRRTEALATWPAVATGHRGFGRAPLPNPLEGSESLRWARTAGVGGRSPWYQRDRANPSDLKAPHCLWKWFLATLAPRRTPCPVWLGSGLSRPSWVPRHGGDSIRAPRSPGCAHQHVPAGPPRHRHREVAACSGPPQPTKSWGPRDQANSNGQQGGAQAHAHPMPASPHHPPSARPGPALASLPRGPAGWPWKPLPPDP